MENEESGTIRTGHVDSDKFEHNMLVHLDGEVSGWGRDMLIIETPSGDHLSLVPVAADGDRLKVMAVVEASLSLEFSLVMIDEKTARLELQKHHVKILADHYARKQ